jgi:hypothetical protein
MDDHTLLVIMASFVAVAAVALLIQAGLLFGIYRASRSAQETIARLAPKVEALVESSRVAVEESRVRIKEIAETTSEVLDNVRRQVARVDGMLTDAAVRTRIQLDRAEMVLDDAMSRVHQTITLVHGGIMRPLRQIEALMTGFRAAIHFLLRRGRPSPDQVTVDEEMFI